MNDAATIIKSMDENPDSWVVGNYRATHKSGVSLWIDGFMYVRVDKPVSIAFGTIDKWRVLSALKRLKSYIIQGKLGCKQEPST